MNSFNTFCLDEGIRPLDASTGTIVRYISWLGLRGTVRASNLQPYLSAINNYFRLHFRRPVAVGDLVTAARQSLARRQRSLCTGAHRVFLPAEVAYRIFHHGYEMLRGKLSLDPVLFRNIVATVFAFFFFDRSGTTRAVRYADIGVTTDTVIFYVHHQKGRLAAPESRRPRLVLRHPYFATLLRGYLRLRAKLPAAPSLLFALPDDVPSAWTSTEQTDWLQRACAAVGASPPAGFTWTSHSLRIGSASAARAVGWTLEQIEYWGGWATLSKALRDSYIVPTVQPCRFAQFFFGWRFQDSRPETASL